MGLRASVLRRVVLFVTLASGVGGLGCAGQPPVPSAPPSLSFRPSPGSDALWLATPIAVEIVNEHDARELEAVDATYIGELGVGEGGRVRPEHLALVAANHGATHFRIVTAGEALRVDVVLYRVEPRRWKALPVTLRPLPPSGPAPADDHA